MASKQFFSFNLVAACAVTFIILTGCKSEQDISGGTIQTAGGTVTALVATPTPSATPTVTPTPVPPELDAEVYFLMDTTWDMAASNPFPQIPTVVDSAPPVLPLTSACLVPFGATPGNAAALTHNCTFQVPEAQLYFSKITMRMGSSDTVNCKYMKLYPYFYAINGPAIPAVAPGGAAPAGVPIPWTLGTSTPASAVCYGWIGGVSPVPPETGIPASEMAVPYSIPACYNGPATAISGFPFNLSVVEENEASKQLRFTIDSAYNKNQLSNRWAASDTAAVGAIGSSVLHEYYLGSMHSYVAQCLNEFGAVTYQTQVIVGAESTGGGAAAAVYKSWR